MWTHVGLDVDGKDITYILTIQHGTRTEDPRGSAGSESANSNFIKSHSLPVTMDPMSIATDAHEIMILRGNKEATFEIRSGELRTKSGKLMATARGGSATEGSEQSEGTLTLFRAKL